MVAVERCAGFQESLDDLRGCHTRTRRPGDNANELIDVAPGHLRALLDGARGGHLRRECLRHAGDTSAAAEQHCAGSKCH